MNEKKKRLIFYFYFEIFSLSSINYIRNERFHNICSSQNFSAFRFSVQCVCEGGKSDVIGASYSNWLFRC